MNKLIDDGVDGIITDYPDRLRTVMVQLVLNYLRVTRLQKSKIYIFDYGDGNFSVVFYFLNFTQNLFNYHFFISLKELAKLIVNYFYIRVYFSGKNNCKH